MDLYAPFKSQVEISQKMSMEHTRYIKFDFHDNDYVVSAIEVIKRVFNWHMFSVNFRGFGTEKCSFDERWASFEKFITGHYGDDVKGFANHIADMIVLDSFTYHIIHNNFDCYDNMINRIKTLFKSGNYLACDISFVNEIDTEEDWNDETIYLDMTTGYIEVR